MTLKSILEYVEAIRDRYGRSTRVEKGQILDEFVKVTGYHRKAAIRVLTKKMKSGVKKRGRPSSYRNVLQPLRSIWEISDRLCSRRLKLFSQR